MTVLLRRIQNIKTHVYHDTASVHQDIILRLCHESIVTDVSQTLKVVIKQLDLQRGLTLKLDFQPFNI